MRFSAQRLGDLAGIIRHLNWRLSPLSRMGVAKMVNATTAAIETLARNEADLTLSEQAEIRAIASRLIVVLQDAYSGKAPTIH
jgi:hypothetical protein